MDEFGYSVEVLRGLTHAVGGESSGKNSSDATNGSVKSKHSNAGDAKKNPSKGWQRKAMTLNKNYGSGASVFSSESTSYSVAVEVEGSASAQPCQEERRASMDSSTSQNTKITINTEDIGDALSGKKSWREQLEQLFTLHSQERWSGPNHRHMHRRSHQHQHVHEHHHDHQHHYEFRHDHLHQHDHHHDRPPHRHCHDRTPVSLRGLDDETASTCSSASTVLPFGRLSLDAAPLSLRGRGSEAAGTNGGASTALHRKDVLLRNNKSEETKASNGGAEHKVVGIQNSGAAQDTSTESGETGSVGDSSHLEAGVADLPNLEEDAGDALASNEEPLFPNASSLKTRTPSPPPDVLEYMKDLKAAAPDPASLRTELFTKSRSGTKSAGMVTMSKKEALDVFEC